MKKNYFKSLAQVAMLLCVPLFIASCDEFGDEDNPIPSYISMSNSPVTITLKYGVDPTFTRTALATSDAAIEYSSEDESIATVDPKTGVVTGVGEGTTKIFAKATGYSKGGKKIFEEATMEYPVTVKDYRANITYALTDTLLASGSTANLIMPKVWPEDGTNIAYSKVEDANNAADIIDAVGPVITLTGKEGKATIKAKIMSTAEGYELESFKNADNEVAATFTIEVKEGIVYMGWDAEKAKPVRKVLFKKDAADKDQYTVLDNAWITEANGATGDDVTLDAGTYYLKARSAVVTLAKNIKIAGDVNFIIANKYDNTYDCSFGIDGKNIVDATANTHTLNIYGESGHIGWFWVDGPATDAAIKNFKEINVYGGNTAANCYSDGGGAINKVSAINVFNGHLKAEVKTLGGYGIKMPEGSKITVSGGLLEAYGAGSNVDNSWAVIGDVVVNKGRIQAQCAGNKAVDGTVTATITKESDDDPGAWIWYEDTKTYGGTWATFTGKPTGKYVWAFTDAAE
jgi:hypothetical protein